MEKSMAAIMSKISADSITVIKDEGQDLGIGFTVGFQIVFDILFICSKPAGTPCLHQRPFRSLRCMLGSMCRGFIFKQGRNLSASAAGWWQDINLPQKELDGFMSGSSHRLMKYLRPLSPIYMLGVFVRNW